MIDRATSEAVATRAIGGLVPLHDGLSARSLFIAGRTEQPKRRQWLFGVDPESQEQWKRVARRLGRA